MRSPRSACQIQRLSNHDDDVSDDDDDDDDDDDTDNSWR